MSPAGALAAVALLLLPPVGLAPVAGEVRCVVRDPRIDEASGLVVGVDAGGGPGVGPEADLMVTANDSGDTGRLFVLDQRCRTVGVTTYDGTATDVEALAPAGGSSVWVGDTGDNASVRDDVVVRRVEVGRGERSVRAASYRLVYPDGPHDAETLLRDPGSGRLYVVTKQLLSSQVYAAPRRLSRDRPNRLTPVARVSLTPTDGAFLPGGHRVVLRGYDAASVYAIPSWRLLGSVRLPDQPQGESLAVVGSGDRVRVGSEGTDEPLLDVRLPARLTATDPAPRGDDATAPTRHDDHVLRTSLLIASLVVVGAVSAGAALVRRRAR